MRTSLTGIRRRAAGVLAACMTAMSALSSLPAMVAYADGGSCGTNATWDLTNGTLTISGSGPVTTIGWNAKRTQITKVVIEEGITSMPNNSFNNYTALTSLVMADTVTSIGTFFCFNCSALQTADISDSVTDIPSSSFYYCRALENLHLPEQLQSIGSSAFYGALSLTELALPNGVTSIGSSAFYGNNIKTLSLGNSLVEIGAGAFDMSCFDSVVIPETVTTIGEKAFTPYYESVVADGSRFSGIFINSPGITTIYGVAGSEAERYAVSAGLNFVALEPSGHTHTWSAWTVETPVSCLANGRNVRTCSGCDEKDYQAVPATGHNWSDWTLSAAASCTTDGLNVRECANCGEQETQIVAATGHSWGFWVAESPATCETDGSRYHTCRVCNETEYETVPAYGGSHNWSDWEVTKQPTTAESGEQVRECDICGYKETQVIPKLDAIVYTISISANSGGTVSPSGDVPVEQGQELTVTITPADDCTIGDVLVDGVSVGAIRSFTFQNIGRDHTLEVVFVNVMPQPHEHLWSDWEVVLAASCEAEGQESHRCRECGETEERAIPATGHSWSDWEVVLAASCEAEGQESHRCSGCEQTEERAIPATGHSWSDWEVIKEPTTSEAGERGRTCSNCHERQTDSIPKLDAVLYTIDISANAGGTVTPVGSKLVEEGSSLTVEIMPDDDMTVSDVLVDGVSVGAVYRYTFENITANHTLEVVFAGELPHAHTWSDWTLMRAVSCETDGKESRSCTACGETEERIIPATGHNWTEWNIEKEPTTTEDGSRERHCTNCDAYEVQNIPKLEVVTYTITVIANEGGTVLPSTRTVEAGSSLTIDIMPHTEHDVKDVLVDGVSIGAVYSYTFENITADHTLEVIFEVVAPLPHEHEWMDWSVATEPTCESDGKEVRRCVGCDETEERTIAAAGHNWTDWFVGTEPTCESDGKEVRHCAVCDKTEERTIAATGHRWSEWTELLQQAVLEYTNRILLDATEATGPKYWLYDLENLAGNGTLTQVILDLTAPFSATGWSGGGGGLGMNFGESWYQADFAASASGADSWTVTLEIPAEYGGYAQDFSEGVIQIGWWWGAGNTLEINRVQFVFDNDAAGGTGTLQRTCMQCGKKETKEPERHTVTISCNEGGSVQPSGETAVVAGGELRVQIQVNDGYRLGDVIVDGVSVLADVQNGSYTFTNVTANHSMSVIFIKDEPQAVRECVEIIVTPKRAAWLSDETQFDIHDFTVTAVISENGSITQVDITNDCEILETPAAAPGPGTYAVTVNYQGNDSEIGAYADAHAVTAQVDIYLRGDTDLNGEINSADATAALREYLQTVVVHAPQSTLTPAQAIAADVNGDGQVTLEDATAILRYYLESFMGRNPQWSDILK